MTSILKGKKREPWTKEQEALLLNFLSDSRNDDKALSGFTTEYRDEMGKHSFDSIRRKSVSLTKKHNLSRPSESTIYNKTKGDQKVEVLRKKLKKRGWPLPGRGALTVYKGSQIPVTTLYGIVLLDEFKQKMFREMDRCENE